MPGVPRDAVRGRRRTRCRESLAGQSRSRQRHRAGTGRDCAVNIDAFDFAIRVDVRGPRLTTTPHTS